MLAGAAADKAAMSGERNAQLVRCLLDAWNDQRDPGFDAYHPDAEWDFSNWNFHAEGSWEGEEEQMEFLANFLREWDQTHVDIEDVVATPGGQVVALVRFSARSRATGAWQSEPGAFLFLFRDGMIARLSLYRDREEALRVLRSALEPDAISG